MKVKSDTISTQPPRMNINKVCMFRWFSPCLSILPESFLKPWEEIQDNQKYKIEHITLSKRYPPIYALCSSIFQRTWPSLRKTAWFLAWSDIVLHSHLAQSSAARLWKEYRVVFNETFCIGVQEPTKECNISLQRRRNYVQRDLYTAVQSFLKEVD